jgi:hypothetical protein
VLHKAVAFAAPNASLGILTAGARDGVLKLWRLEDAAWRADTLWRPAGDAIDRLRDAELGDVDDDGHDEIIVGTHPRGVVVMLDAVPSGDTRLAGAVR